MKHQKHYRFRARYKPILTIVGWGISLLCLIYALANVNLTDMWRAIQRYSAGLLLCGMGLEFTSCSVNGLRKYLLFYKKLPFIKALQAAFLCIGGNTIFPAKFGEIIHALYIAKVTHLPKTKVFPISFLERFTDATLLATFSLFMLSVFESSRWLIFILSVIILVVWSILFIFSYKSLYVLSLIEFIPWEKPKSILQNVCTTIVDHLNLSWMLRLIFSSFLIWLFNIIFYMFAFGVIAGIDLSFMELLGVTAILYLSFSLPSSPGGIGVFEAASVFALGLFGIDHATALAAGLMCHAIKFFVPLGTMCIFISIDKQIKPMLIRAEQNVEV